MARVEYNTIGAASHRNMGNHISGPLRGGAQENTLEISDTGKLDLAWRAREPVVLIGLKKSIEDEVYLISASKTAPGAVVELADLKFDRYSECGTFLPLHKPTTDQQTQTALPHSYTLSLKRIDKNGFETDVETSVIPLLFEVSIVEGVMGTLSYLMGSEHMRLRRTSREISAMRSLAHAKFSALDRLGSELAVPRFTDELEYDKAAREILTRTLNADGTVVVESDDDYRNRLMIYKPHLMPGKRQILEKLNGSAQAGEQNNGLMGRLDFKSLFKLLEDDNEFSFSLHLVNNGEDNLRTGFLAFLRTVYLMAPVRPLENDRFLSTQERAAQLQTRRRLDQSFNFSNDQFIAPMLAKALERVALCREALLGAFVTKRNILRAQSDTHGSRYELGLGVDIQPITQTERNKLIATLEDPNRNAAADKNTEALLQQLAAKLPQNAAEDADAAWFFSVCGLATVHRVSTNRLYLSHLPTQGLVVNGPSKAAKNEKITLGAQYHAVGDPGAHITLLNALSKAQTQWANLGEARFTVLEPAEQEPHWARAISLPVVNDVIDKTGLTAVPNVGNIADRLKRIPENFITTLVLPPNISNDIISGDQSGIDRLSNLKTTLSDAGFASMMVLLAAPNQIVVVTSVIGLPALGSNLSPKRVAGFRWYAVPIQGNAGTVSSIGSETIYTAPGTEESSLSAVVCIGYQRQPKLTDPYEYRVQVEDNAMLSLKQYEYLMNLLAHTHPLGVEINTWTLRQQHVDLDDDGQPDALTPSVSKTYRQFRRIRHRGEFSADLIETNT